MGICGSSPHQGTLEEQRPPGLTVIEVIDAKHLPNVDTGSLTDAYVNIFFKDAYIRSKTLSTGVMLNSLDPVFHSYLAFPFVPLGTDLLEAKLVDEDFIGKDDKIGKTTILFSTLQKSIGNGVTVAIKLKGRLKSEDGCDSSITLRLVRCDSGTRLPRITKDLFVIRHGESVWNDSQANTNIKGMVSQYDHELTIQGIEQARAFNRKWKQHLGESRENGDHPNTAVAEEQQLRQQQAKADFDSFMAAQAIFASPLTRATQTALLTCQDHPLLYREGMLLLRNLREVKNFGSFDTVGKYMGDDILKHVKDVFIRDVGSQETEELLRGVQVDSHDAKGPWWTPLEVNENKKEISERFADVWSFLRYATPAETIILVGHSHFFRFMMKEYMSQEFREREPEWTKELSECKLDNAACMKIRVTWDPNVSSPMDPPKIETAQLVFDSQLVAEKKEKKEKKECSAHALPCTRDAEHVQRSSATSDASCPNNV